MTTVGAFALESTKPKLTMPVEEREKWNIVDFLENQSLQDLGFTLRNFPPTTAWLLTSEGMPVGYSATAGGS